MNKADSIRKHILRKVEEFYRASVLGRFVPGKSYINYAGRVFDAKELVNLVDSSLDFWLTAGRFADRFEVEFPALLGRKHCLLVNSGSSANLLAISALTSSLLKDKRLKPGDEVITTACGFPTTLNPILQNKLVPVFVDVKLGTYNICPEDIEKAISKKTKAIFVAHTLGNPANISQILKVAHKYKLWFCEDNADALGSRYKGRYTGTFSDISTFSFYPAHHITMGEGGAVLTDNPVLNKIMMSLRDWGRDCWCKTGESNTCRKRFSMKFGKLPLGYDHKYVYSHIGYNLKVTDMQAAVGLAQLKKLSGFIRKRIENFNFLYSLFKEYEDYFILPYAEEFSAPSWFGFPIAVKKEAPFTRNDIVSFLEEKRIATRMLFGGNLIKQPAYLGIKYRVCNNLKNTEFVMKNLFWIGVYPGLSAPMLKYIKKALHDFIKKVK